MSCTPCAANTYKALKGNGVCTACTGGGAQWAVLGTTALGASIL